MSTQLLILDSTNVVTLARLRDDVTGDYLDDAEATVSLYDADGAPVADAQDIPMSFTPGTRASEGKYHGTIDATVTLIANAVYDARVTALAADGSTRLFHLACTAVRG